MNSLVNDPYCNVNYDNSSSIKIVLFYLKKIYKHVFSVQYSILFTILLKAKLKLKTKSLIKT